MNNTATRPIGRSAGLGLALGRLAVRRLRGAATPEGLAPYGRGLDRGSEKSVDVFCMLAFEDWFGFGFHLFALYYIVNGLRALRSLPQSREPAPAY